MKNSSSAPQSRIVSIDLLRGLVMVVMALDHVRAYFHIDAFAFSPTDLEKTTPAIFVTRLITHLCAPTFIFLAGTSAYFVAKRKTVRDTSIFLLTRGLWLIVLQVTLVQFAWNFDPTFHYYSSNIISTIGFCMILLSILVHFPMKTILITGSVIVIGHNALDGISFEHGSGLDFLWSFLHAPKKFVIGNHLLEFKYPLIPWIGVMALGYCLGRLYDPDFSAESRRTILLELGAASLYIFLVLRWINHYGDKTPWVYQPDPGRTIMAFLNLEKYPPSLVFLCFTLGISLVVLSRLEGMKLDRWQPLVIFGKVALFYYILHILVIHAVALVTIAAEGYPWQTMLFSGPPARIPSILKGNYGVGLGAVYLLWIGSVVLLYPLCKRWDSIKSRHKKKRWVSYI